MDRVQKLISNFGYCSRRKAEDLIAAGKVAVNGKVIKLGDKAEETDTITIDGKPLLHEKKVYLLFNKPTGCVTALSDDFKKTIMDYIRIKERVFPIGRLDAMTSGLLLLTNDGDFANRVMHPRYEIEKTYRAVLSRSIIRREIAMLEEGIMLEDGKTAPAKVKVVSPIIIEITIHEGRNRIIKRMLKALDITTVSLERTAVGRLTLGDLKRGSFRHLSAQERELIFMRDE